MSSHHFVKEGQEPALFMVEGVSREVAGALLEWAPLVMVADTLLDDVLMWGIKIDVVLIQTGRLAHFSDLLSAQVPLEIQQYSTVEELLLVGLSFLQRQGQKAVNVMANPSESFLSIAERAWPALQVAVIYNGTRWVMATGRYEKWLPAQTELLVKFTKHGQEVLFNGVRVRENAIEMRFDGIAGLSSPDPFWVGEPV